MGYIFGKYYTNTSIYALRNLATVEVHTAEKGMPIAIGGGYPLIFAMILMAPFLLYVLLNYCRWSWDYLNKTIFFIKIDSWYIRKTNL